MIDERRIRITWKARHYDYANGEVVPDLYWVYLDGQPVVAVTTALAADCLAARYIQENEIDLRIGQVKA